MYIMNLIARESRHENSPIHGRDAGEIMQTLAPRRGPERVIDFMVRTGPYGEGFGKDAAGLTLDKLEANPHGIDFGPLKPRIPEVLRTASGKIELAPERIVADVARLRERLGDREDGLLLIGRRHLRSNNSWMHNLPKLVSGKPRCTLQMNPDDAAGLRLETGDTATVTSQAGEVTAPVELCEDMMPGVVSLPHGWGHGHPDLRMGVAADNAGVNTNLLTDENQLDMPSGNSVLCGIPVQVSRAEAFAEDTAVAK
jgi:anaerobic selenocysteine-containing dehydrogenase